MAPGVEKFLITCQVACLAVIAVLNFSPMLGINNTTGSVIAMVAFTTLHARMAMGWRHLAAFSAITAVVSFTSEVVGVATGWVFGSYHYSDHLGPKILGVPPLIQAAYVSMGYASLIIARIILGAIHTAKGWGGLVVAFCGAFIMVSWDVVMDPYQSTILGDWIWRDGGIFFGVPLHNFAGWFFTAFVFMLLYMAYELAVPLPALSGFAARRWFWSLPVINYALIAIGIIITPLVGGLSIPVAFPQNYTGSLAEMQYSLALVAIFAMGTPVVLALARLIMKEPEL